MAITDTRHVPDMTDAKIPSGTKRIDQIMSKEHILGELGALAARQAYEADIPQWKDDHPGETAPRVVPHVEVADPDNITAGERIFVKHYFFTDSELSPGDLRPAVDIFVQVNDTHFPTLNISAYRIAAKNMHDARRAAMGLDPA